MTSENKPLIASIIVHYQSTEECAALVADLAKMDYDNHTIVVVDNQSAAPYFQELQELLKSTKALLVRNIANNGYGAGINYGIKHIKSLNAQYYHIINADTRVINNRYLHELVEVFDHNPQIGLIGPCVQTLNGDIQNTLMPFVTISGLLNRKNAQKSISLIPPILIDAEVINGVCFVISVKAYDEINGFDEDFFMYGEEHDLCYRLKQNRYKCCYWSGLSISHDDYESRTDLTQFSWRDCLIRANQVLFLQKRNRRLSAFAFSILFSLSLIIKLIKGTQLSGIKLPFIIRSFFSPQLINNYRLKGNAHA